MGKKAEEEEGKFGVETKTPNLKEDKTSKQAQTTKHTHEIYRQIKAKEIYYEKHFLKSKYRNMGKRKLTKSENIEIQASNPFKLKNLQMKNLFLLLTKSYYNIQRWPFVSLHQYQPLEVGHPVQPPLSFLQFC